MTFTSVLALVSNFFMNIFNMVLRIQFFAGFSLGQIALMLLVIVSIFDLIVGFAGRSVNDGVSAAEEYRSSMIRNEKSYQRRYADAVRKISFDMNNPRGSRREYYTIPRSRRLR